MKHCLPKSERLNHKDGIDALFSRTCPALLANGFRFSWQIVNTGQESACAVLFVSPKKKLKRAVDRNLRKRLLREFYRLNKNPLIHFLNEQNLKISLSINYVGSAPLDFNLHLKFFQKALQKLILELQKNKHIPVSSAH